MESFIHCCEHELLWAPSKRQLYVGTLSDKIPKYHTHVQHLEPTFVDLWLYGPEVSWNSHKKGAQRKKKDFTVFQYCPKTVLKEMCLHLET